MMYWKRELNSSTLPSSYLEMFTNVCNKACELGYFSKAANSGGVNHDEVMDLLGEVSTSNGHSAFLEESNEADWSFLTSHITNGHPLYLRFGHENPINNADEFVYSYHATVAFGYNVMRGVRDGATYTYKFVKVFDGWDYYSNDSDGNNSSTGKRYVCWDALTTSELNIEIDGYGNVIDHSIEVDMYAIMPY